MQVKSFWGLAAVVYLTVAVVLLFMPFAAFVYDRFLPTVNIGANSISADSELAAGDSLPISLRFVEAEANHGQITTTGGDAQLILENIDMSLRQVELTARFETPPGELDFYYGRKEGQGFAKAKRVWAQPMGHGVYRYTLPPGHVRTLRIDLGTEPGNAVFIEAIRLNPRPGLTAYYNFTMRHAVAFALLPALASCLIYTIIEGKELLVARRMLRFEGGGNAPL